MRSRERAYLSSSALALSLPLALAGAAYWRVLHGEFQFDDGVTIERNPAIKASAGLLEGAFRGNRPLVDLTFAANYAAGGLDPWGYHLVNVAIHLAVVVLVWAFTRAVLRLAGAARGEWVALAVAGVFALHPLQSQAVAYVSQRAEALASGLYLATLLLVLAAERRGFMARAAPYWGAAFGAFLLALGAKPIAVTIPAAWLLLAAVTPSREARAGLLPWRRRLVAIAPFVAVDLFVAARTVTGIGHAKDAGFSLPGLSPWTYFLTQLRVVVVYLRLLVWPAGQNVDWGFRAVTGLAQPAVALSGVLLLALGLGAITLAVRARRSSEGGAAARVAAFGVLWFFLVLSVTSSVVPLADTFVEHRVYLASWGVFAALAVGAERLLARARVRPAVAVAVIAAVWVALGIALHRRNAVWETRLALWSDALAKAPGNARAHASLGFALCAQQRVEEGIAEYRTALTLAGGNAALRAETERNLGAALILAGRLDEAAVALQRGLALSPDDPELLTNLAVVRSSRGDVPGAVALVRRAVEVDPGKASAWNVLGALQLNAGDLPGARLALSRAVSLNPDDGVALYNLGAVNDRLGDRSAACESWRAALGARLPPGLPEQVASYLQRRACR